ncbi:MAG: hypothetical protein V1821_00925 [bacterium]
MIISPFWPVRSSRQVSLIFLIGNAPVLLIMVPAIIWYLIEQEKLAYGVFNSLFRTCAGVALLSLPLGYWLLVQRRRERSSGYFEAEDGQGPRLYRSAKLFWICFDSSLIFGVCLAGALLTPRFDWGIEYISILVKALWAIMTLAILAPALGIALKSALEAVGEIRSYRRIRRGLSATKQLEAERVVFAEGLVQNFDLLLRSPVEKGFMILTLQYFDRLLLVSPASNLVSGTRRALKIDWEAFQGATVVDLIRKRYPELKLGMIMVHSHPELQSHFMPESEEQIAWLIDTLSLATQSYAPRKKLLRGDGSYLDRFFGYMKSWFSEADREVLHILHDYSERIGLLIWGTSLPPEEHKQLRPGYDVVAFRVPSKNDSGEQDAILPIASLREDEELAAVFQNGIGKRLLGDLSAFALAERQKLDLRRLEFAALYPETPEEEETDEDLDDDEDEDFEDDEDFDERGRLRFRHDLQARA